MDAGIGDAGQPAEPDAGSPPAEVAAPDASTPPPNPCSPEWLLDGGAYDAGVLAEAQALVESLEHATDDGGAGCEALSFNGDGLLVDRDTLDEQGRIVEHVVYDADGVYSWYQQIFDGGVLVGIREQLDRGPLHRIDWTYDALGRPLRSDDVTDGQPDQVTTWNWGPDGQLREFDDALGRRKTWHYDGGELIEFDQFEADGGVSETRLYRYGDAGVPSEVDHLDGLGNFTGADQYYRYDDQLRVRALWHFQGNICESADGPWLRSPCMGDDVESFDYADNGVLTHYEHTYRAVYGNESHWWNYDDSGRLIENGYSGFEQPDVGFRYQYVGNRIARSDAFGQYSRNGLRVLTWFDVVPGIDLTANSGGNDNCDGSCLLSYKGGVEIHSWKDGRLMLGQLDSDGDCVPESRRLLARDAQGVLRVETWEPASPISRVELHGTACPAFPTGYPGWTGYAYPPSP